MKIKNPTLIYKRLQEVYEVDVEGTKVIATYTYDMDNEQSGGWDYDLEPCYVDLDDDEIDELEEEFCQALYDAKMGVNYDAKD
jgi:hypothetical protein